MLMEEANGKSMFSFAEQITGHLCCLMVSSHVYFCGRMDSKLQMTVHFLLVNQ